MRRKKEIAVSTISIVKGKKDGSSLGAVFELGRGSRGEEREGARAHGILIKMIYTLERIILKFPVERIDRLHVSLLLSVELEGVNWES